MTSKKPIIAMVITLIAPAAHAAIYQCTDAQGKKVFSQLPCAPDAKKITIETDEPTAEQAEATRNANAQNRKLADEGEENRGLRNARARIDSLVKARDREIATLKTKKLYAANNLAGATWEKSISDEMQAVAERYNADISAARDHLRDLERTRDEKRDQEKN